MTPLPIIDAHIHFWDPGKRHHAWLSGEPLPARRFVPDHVPAGHHDVVGFVFVQADCRDGEALDEVAWVSRLAEAEPRIQAIVAHAPLERGHEARPHLDRLATNARVVGVRRWLQDQPDTFLAQPSFVAGVRLLAEFGFTFDVCVRHSQLRAVAELVSACPQVTFVLDHLGKPAVAAGTLDPWRADLGTLAQHPNVLCKLSGLTTVAAPRSWRPADLTPYLAHAIDVFGPQRCLVGSDWPVATLTTTFEQWFDLVLDALSDLGESELRAVLADNAGAAYGLTSFRQDNREMERADARSDVRR